ncbi:MAG: hypothetical protein E6J34_16025 [Chloroflexi bacterium]|nr:MAG: hypothetical protein E6J34_16025 [Chloroflexota bacterium]
MPSRLVYDEAMSFSRIRLKVQEPELKEGKVETVTTQTAVGTIVRPWGIEGGFAIVYKFRTKSGHIRALRCFSVPASADTQFRYERIGAYFRAHIPQITAGFKYHNKGILVKEQGKSPDQIYPIIEMDWIDGSPLTDTVHELCQQGNRLKLRDIAEQWVKIIDTLRTAHIAHGDLAGANVMVRVDGKLILIDYDGVYIPEFAGLPQLLTGQPDFQHPHVAQRKFDEQMDHFSALVIYTSLIALADQPALWRRYAKISARGGKPEDSNLLFRKEDFEAPDRSPLFQDLERMGNAQVRTMIQALKQACSQSVHDVRFSFALIDPEYQQKQALEELMHAMQAQDDQQILQIWSPLLAQYAPAQRYQSRVQLAQRRILALQVFHQALHTQDLQSIINGYDASQLQASQLITSDERQLLSLAQSFLQAYQQDDESVLIATADTLQKMTNPTKITFTPAQQQRLQLARMRKDARRHIQAAFASKYIEQIANIAPLIQTEPSLTTEERQRASLAVAFLQAYNADDDDAILAACAAIDSSGQRSAFIFTPSQDARISLGHQRQQLLTRFRDALRCRQPARIVAAYHSFLDNSSQITRTEHVAIIAIEQSAHRSFFDLNQEEEDRIALARRRKMALWKFRQALKSKNARQIATEYDPLLDHDQRILPEERNQLIVARLFVTAFDSDDDEACVTAREEQDKYGITGFLTFTAQEQQRLALAQQRFNALKALRAILSHHRSSALRIAAAYDASLLDSSKNLTPDERAIISSAKRYLAMYEAIQAALQTESDETICNVYDSTLAEQFSDFTPQEIQCINQALQLKSLEQLLLNEEYYGQALRMARTLQATRRGEISDSLIHKLKRATLRFIKDNDLSQMAVRIEERADSNYAIISWHWPEDNLIQHAQLRWRAQQWYDQTAHGKQDEQWNTTWCRRRNNAVEGLCTFSIGTYSSVYAKGYAALLDDWDREPIWRFSKGYEPTSYAEGRSTEVTYGHHKPVT